MAVMVSLLRGVKVGGSELSLQRKPRASTGRFLCLPNGTGRSKLSAAVQEHTAAAGMHRSWRTVTMLTELANSLAHSD